MISHRASIAPVTTTPHHQTKWKRTCCVVVVLCCCAVDRRFDIVAHCNVIFYHIRVLLWRHTWWRQCAVIWKAVSLNISNTPNAPTCSHFHEFRSLSVLGRWAGRPMLASQRDQPKFMGYPGQVYRWGPRHFCDKKGDDDFFRPKKRGAQFYFS